MLIVVILLVYIMYRAFSIVLSFTDIPLTPLLKNAPQHNPDYLRKFYALDQSKRDLLFDNFQDSIEDVFFKQLWTCTHSPLLVIRAKNFQDLSHSEKFDEIMMFLENLDLVVFDKIDKSKSVFKPKLAQSKNDESQDESQESEDESNYVSQDASKIVEAKPETPESPDGPDGPVQDASEVPDLPDSPRQKKLKRTVKPKASKPSKKKLDLTLT